MKKKLPVITFFFAAAVMFGGLFCVSDRHRIPSAGIAGYHEPLAGSRRVLLPADTASLISLDYSTYPGAHPLVVMDEHPFNGTVGKGDKTGTLIYRPNTGYVGYDRFTFFVHDGVMKSNRGEVVIFVGEKLSVSERVVAVTEDEVTEFHMPLSNPLGLELNWILSQEPENGTVTPVNGTLWSYMPNQDFSGNDSLQFHVVSEGLVSETGKVTFIVDPVNDPPKAYARSWHVDEDHQLFITLSAVDADSPELGYHIIDEPRHGSLVVTGDGYRYCYTPHENYYGNDSFTWYVSDGMYDSAVVTETIIVAPVIDPPLAHDQQVIVYKDTPRQLIFLVENPDKGPLVWDMDQPSEGTLEQIGGNRWRIVPGQNYVGTFDFSYGVTDLHGNSSRAEVHVIVRETAVLHVRSDAGPGGDGTSWQRAFNHPAHAAAAAGPDVEIWIAEGTYYPLSVDSRTVVTLPSHVRLRGGFSGHEISVLERDTFFRETVLNGNGTVNHVILLEGNNYVEQITVTGGAARGDGDFGHGGGMFAGGEQSEIVQCRFVNNHGVRGGGFALAPSGTAGIINTLFQDNSAQEGGGIYGAWGSSITMVDSRVFDNRAENRGGGVSSYGSRFSRFDNVHFRGNSADQGGALSEQFSTVHMDWSQFDENRAEIHGGAVYSSDSRQSSCTGSSFTNNSALARGGAFYHEGAASYVMDRVSFIEANNAPFGGAVFNRGSLDVRDSLFMDNRGDRGGALYSSGNLEVNETVFEQNSAVHDGGALFLQGNNYMRNVTVQDNSSQGRGGGAVLWFDCSLDWEKGLLVRNEALEHGGAVYAEGVHRFFGSELLFQDNSSQEHGGAVYAYRHGIFSQALFLVQSSIFTRNRAIDSGGGVHLSLNWDVSHTWFHANSAVDGGALAGFGTGRLFNSLFSWNRAAGDDEDSPTGRGGALFIEGSLAMAHGTIANNHAVSSGHALYAEEAESVIIKNSIISDAGILTPPPMVLPLSASITFSLVGQNPYGQLETNSSGSPLFLSEPHSNYRLQGQSPARALASDEALTFHELEALLSRTTSGDETPAAIPLDAGYHYAIEEESGTETEESPGE